MQPLSNDKSNHNEVDSFGLEGCYSESTSLEVIIDPNNYEVPYSLL